MVVAVTHSRAQLGIHAPLVTVEADISAGLPKVLIVGMPETAVKESKDRVKAAIQNAGFEMPSRRVTINLAPADLPKQGGRYDLAIALAILAASGQLPVDAIVQHEFIAELALEGSLRAVNGVLPATLQNRDSNRTLIVSTANGPEAALANSKQVFIANHLREVHSFLTAQQPLERPVFPKNGDIQTHLRIEDIKGQAAAKRSLIIAAAGGHNLLMVGPPGTGKTMLASRLCGLLPEMNQTEALESASIYSVSKFQFDHARWGQRPFRAPHHTASAVALVGGGNPPRPGEISLAHHGVLFLDELPEFSRHVLEVLREPLESGTIVISRANHSVCYPSGFQLVSAMNPCPCGYYGDPTGRCECASDRIKQYRSKVSGPLMDRIDLHVDVPPINGTTLLNTTRTEGPTQAEAQETVKVARDIMVRERGKLNAHLNSAEVDRYCQISASEQSLLETAVDKLGLSTRGYYKVLRVARTIADLSGTDAIERQHLTEAIGYRKLDRALT